MALPVRTKEMAALVLDVQGLHGVSRAFRRIHLLRCKHPAARRFGHLIHSQIRPPVPEIVSAHFLKRCVLAALQFDSCEFRAWHAGASSWRGRENCNDYSVGIELEGLEGEAFEAAQYTSLVRLLRALMRRYPLAFVAGHEHVAAGRKNDPGAGLDWHRLTHSLRWPQRMFPHGAPSAKR